MRIGELSKKYGIERRTIDYWTTLGLIHPETDPKNGFRIYGPKAEEELQRVIIADIMGWKLNEESIKSVETMPKEGWNEWVMAKIRYEEEEAMKKFRVAEAIAMRLGGLERDEVETKERRKADHWTVPDYFWLTADDRDECDDEDGLSRGDRNAGAKVREG